MVNLIFRILIIVTVLFGFIASLSHAQSLFDFSGPSKKTNNSPPTRALSPEQFKTKVKNLDQQVRNELSQEVNQEFIKQPPVKPSALPPPTEEPMSSPQPVAESPPPVQTPPPVSTAPPQTLAPPPPKPQAAPGAYGSSPPTPQTQPYSGFGTGNTNNNGSKTTNDSSSNSQGWNIKY